MRTLMRLVGIAAMMFGLGLAGAALVTDAGELQVLFGVFALAGLLIVLAGGFLVAIGALLGRGKKAKAPGPVLTPEQQQILDVQEFLASRHEEKAGR